MDANDLRNLKESIDNLSMSISNNAENIRRSSNQVNDDLGKLGKSASSVSAANQSIVTANEKYAASMKEFNNATAQTVKGLQTFTGALLNSERNFGKYSDTVTSFGNALSSVLKALGPFGAVLGGVVQGMTKVAEASLKQADNVVKAYDELAKVGGAGGITTKQILEMGLQAGLMSKDLNKLTGVIRTNSKDIAALGLSATDGMKVFGQLAAVGTKTIATYSKLGVSQEDLLKTQADYLALQTASGNSLRSELRDKVKLQKATLEYQDNLLVLSKLTGEDVDSLKKKQKEAAMELNFMVKNRQDELRERELRAQGRTQEADQLAAELKARKDGNNALVMAAPELGKAVREFQASGTASGEAAQAMQRMGLGNAIAEYNKAIKEGKNVEEAKNKLINEYNRAQDRVVQQVGTNAGLASDTAKAFGLSSENIQRRVQQEKDLTEAERQARKELDAAKKGGDPALDARAKLTALEIEAGTALERFLAKINPLLSGFNLETIAGQVATGAAIAAATWLGGKLLKGVFGGGGAAGMPGGIPTTGGVGAAGRAAGAATAAGAAPAAGAASKAMSFGGKALGALSKLAAPVAGLIAVGQGVMTAREGLATATTMEEKGGAVGKGTGQAVGGVGGAAAGAAIGTAIFPVVGTAIGAAIGGWLGSKGGEKVGETVGKVAGKALEGPESKKITEKNLESESTLNSSVNELRKSINNLKISIDALGGKIVSAGTVAGAAGGAGGGAGGGSTGSAVSGGGGVSGGSGAGGTAAAPNFSARSVSGPVQGTAAPKDDIEGKVGGGGGIRTADAGDAAKGKRRKTDGIIVHHTGGRGLQAAISTLKSRGLGYHYMVDQDGSITSFVPDDQTTWHAGKTDKKPELSNSNSVSISLVSRDDTDVSPAQLKSGFGLGKELMSKYGMSMVYGHGETSSHKMATEGKTLAEALRSGKLPQARSGGIFSGPESGYLALLHGKETVYPERKIPNMLASGQVSKEELPFGSTANASSSGDNRLMVDLMSMMESKFDNMINVLQQSNDTQSQILRYSKA